MVQGGSRRKTKSFSLIFFIKLNLPSGFKKILSIFVSFVNYFLISDKIQLSSLKLLNFFLNKINYTLKQLKIT